MQVILATFPCLSLSACSVLAVAGILLSLDLGLSILLFSLVYGCSSAFLCLECFSSLLVLLLFTSADLCHPCTVLLVLHLPLCGWLIGCILHPFWGREAHQMNRQSQHRQNRPNVLYSIYRSNSMTRFKHRSVLELQHARAYVLYSIGQIP